MSQKCEYILLSISGIIGLVQRRWSFVMFSFKLFKHFTLDEATILPIIKRIISPKKEEF